MSPAEFDRIDVADPAWRYELIDGRVIVMPPPKPGQRDPNDELGYLLRRHREDHPEGAALDRTLPEHPVRTGENRRVADRVIWVGLGRMPDPVDDVLAIAVEFASEGRCDRVEKRTEHLAAGIREYWVVDRFARTVTVWRAGPSGHRRQTWGAGSVLRTTLLPGFGLPVDRLLRSAEEWG